MKKLTQLTLVLLAMITAFAGCDAAKNAATDASNKATEMADMGGFDLAGLTTKINDIKDGFKNVTAENVDNLKAKISEFGTTVDEIDVEKIPANVKPTASATMSKFAETLKGLMAKVPEGVAEKLKSVVEPLMEKLTSFGS